MERVGIVSPTSRTRRVLVEVADRGVFEPDPPHSPTIGPIASLAQTAGAGAADLEPLLTRVAPDPDELAAGGELGRLAGEASLEARLAATAIRGQCTILPGWIRADDLPATRAAIESHGGAIVPLPGRPGLVPPTAYAASRTGAAFRPLVTTYGTVPYSDVDPTLFAAAAYVVMFGMMFGDVAHGLAILLGGIATLIVRRGPLVKLRAVSWFLVAAGAAATAFGFLYGEAFGPTGLVPTLWIRPLDEPQTFLLAGLAIGLVLLGITFGLSIVNRWREGGPAAAIFDGTGVAGALLLLGGAAAAATALTSWPLTWVAAACIGLGAALVFTGFVASSGASSSGLAQAVIELFDTLLRLGSNIVSFTRLAAFGLTHAVITEVVWDGTTSLWDRSGPIGIAGAVVLFAAGNLAAFALGALVAGIQALRLEYYELFSRLFATSGRTFRPWHVALLRSEES
jgi:V/A-type H+-transporting ATPase subunit I